MIDSRFSKSLVSDRLLVELEGNLIDNQMSANSNMSNFLGEATITWLIDQNGNLKLKGFHADDRPLRREPGSAGDRCRNLL